MVFSFSITSDCVLSPCLNLASAPTTAILSMTGISFSASHSGGKWDKYSGVVLEMDSSSFPLSSGNGIPSMAVTDLVGLGVYQDDNSSGAFSCAASSTFTDVFSGAGDNSIDVILLGGFSVGNAG